MRSTSRPSKPMYSNKPYARLFEEQPLNLTVTTLATSHGCTPSSSASSEPPEHSSTNQQTAGKIRPPSLVIPIQAPSHHPANFAAWSAFPAPTAPMLDPEQRALSIPCYSPPPGSDLHGSFASPTYGALASPLYRGTPTQPGSTMYLGTPNAFNTPRLTDVSECPYPVPGAPCTPMYLSAPIQSHPGTPMHFTGTQISFPDRNGAATIGFSSALHSTPPPQLWHRSRRPQRHTTVASVAQVADGARNGMNGEERNARPISGTLACQTQTASKPSSHAKSWFASATMQSRRSLGEVSWGYTLTPSATRRVYR